MILFNEVKRLSETSEAAFTHFYNIMSRKDSGGKDILYKSINFKKILTNFHLCSILILIKGNNIKRRNLEYV